MNSLLGKIWHHLPASEVLGLLDSDIQQGLDDFEIKHRQEHFGANVLTPKKGKSPASFPAPVQQPAVFLDGDVIMDDLCGKKLEWNLCK